MAFKASSEQQKVISTINTNLIVSAGAGSGKTATLSEKVYQLVKNGNKISRFLVLTFTNTAANEMKNRIRDKLADDESTLDQSLLVDNAHIETFDSFALFIVKKYCKELGLSSDINIIDQNVLNIKRHEICDDIFEKLYETKDSIFLDFIKKNCVRNDSDLRNKILNFSSFVRKQIDKEKYLSSYIETNFNEEKIQSYLNEYFTLVKDYCSSAIDTISQYQGCDSNNSWQGTLNHILSANNFDSQRDVLLYYGENGIPKTKHDGEAKNYNFGDLLAQLKKDFFINEKKNSPGYGDSKTAIKEYLSQKGEMELIVRIVKELEKQTDDFQNSCQCYSFEDIQMLALKAINIPNVGLEVKNTFDFIMVDEYQDTSDIQDNVINLLSKQNTMVVGDVKQSIFRFRNANCDNFLQRYNNYQKSNGGQKIDMNYSYRSRREIVDFVNDTFSKLMKSSNNPIDYSNGHNFGFGAKYYDDNIQNGISYRPKIVSSISDEMKPFDYEIEMIAHDIIDKINNGYKFMHKKADGSFAFEEAVFSDFAIIIDKGTQFDIVSKIFGKYGIPLNVVNDENIQDLDVTIVLRNILKAIYLLDKPEQLIYLRLSLWAINRSFLTDYNDDDIYHMHIDDSLFTNDVYNLLNEIKNESFDKSLFEICTCIYKKFNLLEKISKLGEYTKNYHIAEYFLSLMKSMDQLGFGIEGAIKYFDDIKDIDNCDIKYRDLDVREDSVTLINIHKSKGLEYGYVYFPGFDHGFYRGNSDGYIFSNKYGFVQKYPKHIKHENVAYTLAEIDEKKATFYEKLRLLYVAITRAKEGITIFFTSKPSKEKKPPILHDIFCYSNFKKLISFYMDDLVTIDEGHIDISTNNSLNIPATNINEISYSIDGIKPMDKELVNQAKASKINIVGTSSLLEFGSLVHAAIEATDFDTKDTSFIKNSEIKKFVENIVNSKVFSGIHEENIRKEFPFYDNENGVNGFIDCLIEKPDEVIIVDFKFKDLDDADYVKQLHAYRDYVSTLSSKKIRMFLLSYLSGEEKEIE